jgi:hypothetical protein
MHLSRGDGIHLSRESWNPWWLESIYHERVGIYLSRGAGIHLSRGGLNPFITKGWNLIDRFNPATHSRTCKHLDFYAQRL